jgi:hypothetical protein
MGQVCSTQGRDDKYIQNFSGELEGKRPIGKPGRRPEDNIKINLKDIGFEVWTRFKWLRIVISNRLL